MQLTAGVTELQQLVLRTTVAATASAETASLFARQPTLVWQSLFVVSARVIFAVDVSESTPHGCTADRQENADKSTLIVQTSMTDVATVCAQAVWSGV